MHRHIYPNVGSPSPQQISKGTAKIFTGPPTHQQWKSILFQLQGNGRWVSRKFNLSCGRCTWVFTLAKSKTDIERLPMHSYLFSKWENLRWMSTSTLQFIRTEWSNEYHDTSTRTTDITFSHFSVKGSSSWVTNRSCSTSELHGTSCQGLSLKLIWTGT